MVVPKSGYHFPLSSDKRIESMIDEGTWQEFDSELESKDLLKFKDTKAYADRLKIYKEKTGLNDAIVCGIAKMGGIKVSLSVMDFRFGGASMGSVVGQPSLSRAQPSGICSPCSAIFLILPREETDMAMSNTKGDLPSKGTPTPIGLLPTNFSNPPEGAITANAFVPAIPIIFSSHAIRT